MSDEILLSIVIPAYNEEKRIGRSLEKIFAYLSSKDFLWELIIVNDGSTDDTLSIISGYNEPRIILVNNKKNMGKGYSVKRGVEEAKGRFIVFSDADLSTPVGETDKLLEFLRKDYDFVIGSRYVPGSEIKVRQPWYRQLMGRFFNLFVRLVAIPGIKDTQCGFKGFKRECALIVFDLMEIRGYSFDVEALYIAYKLGFKIKEVPVVWYDSPSSRINPFIDPLKMFFEVIRIVWNHRNTRWYRTCHDD